MKPFVLTILLFTATWSFGQSKVLEVVASAGGYTENTTAGISLSWTLGETVIATFAPSGSSIILTQGFQQGNLFTVDVPDPDLPTIDVTIYPNPAIASIWFRFNHAKPNGEVIVRVYDISGRVVMEKNMGILTGDDPLPLNISSLKSGLYLVNLRSGASTSGKIFKLIKE